MSALLKLLLVLDQLEPWLDVLQEWLKKREEEANHDKSQPVVKSTVDN